jgi:biotin carboxyl carrier protein
MKLPWKPTPLSPIGLTLLLSTLLALGGCDPSGGEAEHGEHGEHGDEVFVLAAHKHDTAGETCFICDATKRDKGRLWCNEHARYEDRCWLCHPELEDKTRLWCKEHSLYEDECFLCHPEILEGGDAPKKTETSSDNHTTSEARSTQPPTMAPTTRVSMAELFCNEHGVAEIECAICQPGLASSLRPGEGLKIRFASAQSTFKAGVETAPPLVSDTAPGISVFSEVRYNENALARVTPQAPGIVRKVLVDVGSAVKAGDVLAELDSPELARAKSDYLARLQGVELAQIDLKRSQVLYENTQQALKISEGEISESDLEALSRLDLGLNRRDLLTTHAKFAAAKAAYEREKALLAQEIGSRADFQEAEAAYRMAWAEQLARPRVIQAATADTGAVGAADPRDALRGQCRAGAAVRARRV